MPAFKFKAARGLPGAGGQYRAQGRGLSAPTLRAPQKQTVLMGRQQQRQFVPERTNLALMKVTEDVKNLGNMFFRQSIRQADEQSTLEASEAISRYRRSVSDAYYNEQDGLFSKTGVEASTVFRDNQETVNGLRDNYAEGLSDSAKRKYLTKVAGYHNQYLDQLAKKQFNNVAQYRHETRVMTEGADAADIFSFLKNDEIANVPAILKVLNDTPDGLTDVEAQNRIDRLIFGAIGSADAQNVDADSMENLINGLRSKASQKVENAMLEGLDEYRRAEKAQIDFEKKQAEREKADLKIDQDKSFVELFRDDKLTPRMVMDSDLLAARQEHWLARIDNKDIVESNAELTQVNSRGRARYQKMVMRGDFSRATADKVLDSGLFDGKELFKMLGDSKKAETALKDKLYKKPLEKAKEYYNKGAFGKGPKSVDRWYDVQDKIINTPEGVDPFETLEKEVNPDKQGWFGSFVDGFVGNTQDLENSVSPIPVAVTPEISTLIAQIDNYVYSQDGISAYDKYEVLDTQGNRDEYATEQVLASIAAGHIAKQESEIDYSIAGLTGEIDEQNFSNVEDIIPAVEVVTKEVEDVKPKIVATFEEIVARQGKIRQSKANDMVLDALNTAGNAYAQWKIDLANDMTAAFVDNNDDTINIFQWVDNFFSGWKERIAADYKRNRRMMDDIKNAKP